jgi:hypothetical protein
MSDDKSGGAATDQETSGHDQKSQESEASGADKVSYDTYKKTVSEVKRLKAEIKAKEDALTAAQQEKLSAEGNKDELINQLKTQVAKLDKQNKDTLNSFVFMSLDTQVRKEAEKLGCVDPDAVVRLADFSGVDVDHKTFMADQGQLVQVIADLKKTKPYLFGRAGTKINTQTPGGSIDVEKKKPLKDMTKDELWSELKKVKAKSQ